MILATCYNNKLTNSIYDGDRAVDWTQAKTMEGPTDINMTRCLYGAGRRTVRQLAGHEIHFEIDKKINL